MATRLGLARRLLGICPWLASLGMAALASLVIASRAYNRHKRRVENVRHGQTNPGRGCHGRSSFQRHRRPNRRDRAATKAALEGVIADVVFELESRGPLVINSGNASRPDTVTRDGLYQIRLFLIDQRHAITATFLSNRRSHVC